jgi:hypothetical protein
MVKYVEGSFDEDYIQTLGLLLVRVVARLISCERTGVNFMEKTASLR